MEKKILLVEDNKVNQMVALDSLQEADFQVSVADNGQEALEMLVKESFDCVLMDCQMPIMDGYEATRRIRENNCSIPIIAMTADAMEGDKEKCLEAGMNDYLSKPFIINDLLSLLKKWIPNKKINNEVSNDPSTINKMVEGDLPELPGIDKKEGLAIVGGNSEMYKKILKKFYQINSNILSDIKKALETGEKNVAVRLVHTVRGNAVNIGAKDLAEISQRLESTIKNEEKEELDFSLETFSSSLISILETLKVFSSQEEKQ